MSYSAQSGFWDGGSGVTDLVKDTRPPWVMDFSKKRAEQKKAAFAKFGYYKNADGSPMRFANNRSQPVTSFTNGWALTTYWQQIGESMLQQAIKAQLQGFRSGLADPVKAANDRFKKASAAWIAKAASTRLLLNNEAQLADELWDGLLSTYVIELDNATWSGFNIEDAFSRAIWAVKESAVELGKKLGAPIIDMLTAGEIAWKLLKWGTIAAVGVTAVWGISKIAKKEKGSLMPVNKFTMGSGRGGVGGHGNVREMLLSFGVGQYNVPMAIQYAFFIPRTTDPDAQGVQLLVECAQRGLNRLGAGIKVNGSLDEDTVRYLRRVSGQNWHAKTWVQILGDLSDAQNQGKQIVPVSAVSGYETVGLSTDDVVDAAFGRPARIGAASAGAFHGYRRTGSIGFALFYAALGYINPPIGGAVMVAQGFGKRRDMP